MSAKDRAIQFVGKFLSWYQESYGQSDVVSRVALERLVKEAEEIHVEKLKEIEAIIDREKELREFMNKRLDNTSSLTIKKHTRTKSGSVRRKK